MLRAVQFSGMPKQRFDSSVTGASGKYGIKSELGQDSWLYHLNYMNQDKFIPSKQIMCTTYKYMANHKKTFHLLCGIYKQWQVLAATQ